MGKLQASTLTQESAYSWTPLNAAVLSSPPNGLSREKPTEQAMPVQIAKRTARLRCSGTFLAIQKGATPYSRPVLAPMSYLALCPETKHHFDA